MPLSKNEIARLLKLVAQTEDHELNCEQCLAVVAEFAESKLSGKSLPVSLHMVEQHLEICSECREEYEALRQTIDSLNHDQEI